MRKLFENDSTRIYSVGMGIALLFGFIVFLAVIITAKTPDIRFNSEKVALINNGWEVSTETETRNIELPYRQEADAGETICYSIKLPLSEITYNCVMFRTTHEYIKVWLAEKLIYEFGYGQSVFFSDKPNNGWMLIRLPDGYQGKVLRIEKTGYYDNYAGSLDNVYIGTKNALVFYLMDRYMPIIFIDLGIIILSLVLLGISFFFKRELVYQVRYLSVFSLITSIWLVLESGGYQLFAGRAAIVSNTLFIMFSLIPLAFIRFLLTYECFSESRYMKVLFGLSFGGFLTIHFLQFARVMDYLNSVFIIHILILLAVGGIIGKYIRMRVIDKRVTNHSLFLSVFAFAGFAFIDIVRFYIVVSPNPSLFSQIGVLCFFVILFAFAIKNIAADIESRRKEALLRQMAYMDLLTGLPNRNAFEKKMELFRKEQWLRPTIIIMDINGLKEINDTYGHRSGDVAIISLADLIKECFMADADIFRIGGDEFCIIMQEITEADLHRRLNLFDERCAEKNRELEIPVFAAVGWSIKEEGEDIEKAFGKADEKMYESKKKMKSHIE